MTLKCQQTNKQQQCMEYTLSNGIHLDGNVLIGLTTAISVLLFQSLETCNYFSMNKTVIFSKCKSLLKPIKKAAQTDYLFGIGIYENCAVTKQIIAVYKVQ